MTNVEASQAEGGPARDVHKAIAGEESRRRPPRKFVLFADGTGNAFTKQESNIWRLYEALDRTRPDQIAYYIKGVGTAGWAPLAALDGATGFGVPSNVRRLYRFLCWNWQPGDEIYIFGFSRGSFTARTLAGMISSQGLMPVKIDGLPVSRAEMQRNTKSAWRAYRKDAVRWCESLPTIWVVRLIRDIITSLWDAISRRRSYRQVRTAMDGRRDVEIAFLGLFDTVEAFGVPFEELRKTIDWVIWPISFRNGVLSSNVKRACHALALDDERTTFRPLRFERSVGDPRVTEVWFAGMHSDVGGGYPDGTLSLVPLVWIASHVEDRLRFRPGHIDNFRACQSAMGPIHRSRSGLSVMYRYGPRLIGERPDVDGGPPIVHLGVIERMLMGHDDYAPVALPASVKVLLPSGKVIALTDEDSRREMWSAYHASQKASRVETAEDVAAADTFARMMPPDHDMVQQVLATVWWRRFWSLSLLASIAFLVTWPFMADSIIGLFARPIDQAQISADVSLLDVIRWFDYGVAGVTGPPLSLLRVFLPSYAEPWLKIAIFYPTATLLVVFVVAIAWQMNSFLRDRIEERARLVWNGAHRMVTDIGKPTPLLLIGRFMGLRVGLLPAIFTGFLLRVAFPPVIYGAVLLMAGRGYFAWGDTMGGFRHATGFCRGTEWSKPKVVGEEALLGQTIFETRNPCWSSGLWVEKGRKYRVLIAIKDPWFDRTIMTGVNGFQLSSPEHLAAVPLRRWISEAWFQPIVRIGASADAEQPLRSIDGTQADKLPRLRDPTIDPRYAKEKDKFPVRVEDSSPAEQWPQFDKLRPIPEQALEAAQKVWRQQGLTSLMVADFTAAASGELFLYVNDAIQLMPFLGPFDLFYRNNSGSAEVTVKRIPSQP
jgi:uncharacterized protein (DUF2235 family)